MFPETLETESLVLRPLDEAHVDVLELYELFSSDRDDAADVFEYVPQEPYLSVNDARDRLRTAESSWEDGDSAQYAAYTAANDLAGYAGLFPEWDRRLARIGFTLAAPYWGRGYAGECATALTSLAFDRLDLGVVAFDHAVGHDRSKRAIESFVDDAGGGYDGLLRNWRVIDDEPVDHRRYTVTREQYLQSNRDS